MNDEERMNPFCVVSIETFGEYTVHDIQTKSSWTKNPYETGYAVVPDEMVKGIIETRGFCDITLSEDGTEVVSFTARDIPDIPTPEPVSNDVWDELDKAYQEGVNSI